MRVQNEILSNLKEEKILLEKRLHRINTKYEDLIKYKLIPILRDYDIDIQPIPVINNATEQVYYGFDKDFNKISFIFTSQGDELDSEEHKRWSLFLKILYKNQLVDVGVIDLNSLDDVHKSFSLLSQTLEDMGFKLREDKPEEEPEEKEEVDPDIQAILDYKNSLSESELKELEKELKE